MVVLPNMGLVKWDQINDPFSHDQMAANFDALDAHDHTSGKGKQIGAGGLAPLSVSAGNLQDNVFTASKIADGTINTAKFADGSITNAKLASSGASIYRTLTQVNGLSGSLTTGTIYYCGYNGTLKSGTSSITQPTGVLYIQAADFTINGLTPKLQLTNQLATNSVASAVNWTFGLYPITIAGGASAMIPTLGTVVTGSTSTFTAPVGSTFYNSQVSGAVVTTVSSDFALPADGYYIPGFVVSGSQASTSIVVSYSQLKFRYV